MRGTNRLRVVALEIAVRALRGLHKISFSEDYLILPVF